MNAISPMAAVIIAILAAFVCASIVTMVIRGIHKKKKAPEPSTPPPTAATPEQQPKTYTYEEFSRDFMNENVSIDDMLKRYSGAEIPPAPKEDEPKKEPEPEPEPEKPKAEPESPERDLAAERQEWFAKASEKQQKLKIVPAPVPQVVVSVKGITVPCPSCKGSYEVGRWVGPPRQRYTDESRCSKCNGMGVVVIVGGK